MPQWGWPRRADVSKLGERLTHCAAESETLGELTVLDLLTGDESPHKGAHRRSKTPVHRRPQRVPAPAPASRRSLGGKITSSGTAGAGNRGARIPAPGRENLYRFGRHWEHITRRGIPQCHLSTDDIERAVHLLRVQPVSVHGKFGQGVDRSHADWLWNWREIVKFCGLSRDFRTVFALGVWRRSGLGCC